MKISLLAGVLCMVFASCSHQADVVASYDIIPKPQQITMHQGASFRLDDDTRILYSQADSLLRHNAVFLSEYIAQSTGYRLETAPLSADADVEGAIVLDLDKAITDKEGYVLEVAPQKITISGQTPNGVFYGVQALRKSIPAQAPDNGILLPAVTIQDAPRFAYRGMHLDVCRHFFPLDFVKRYIDLLALHNMNVFHWHLTDDQGWRIEIKKYPRLTEVGSMRNRTVIGRNSGEYDNKPHGGYYTQEEAREIVEYARQRYITVIPEVDMPGHMLAALAAYPELGCTGGPYEVCPEWGVFEDVLCLGNDKTLEFLEGVMDEITEIFPSEYIHIGGDEVPRTRWEQCPKCQKRIHDEHLRSDKEHSAEDRLQSYCMKRIGNYLKAKGRKIIGWDEILEGDIPADATVMSWRGSAGGIKAAQMGHDVVMVPNNYCYFDYYQSLDTEHEPFAIGGYVPVDHVYSFEPTASLTEDQKKHILGLQANLWTEYIPTTEYAEYMVLPRMAALAEVQWLQPERKDYDDFLSRLQHLVAFYQRDGYQYAKHALPKDSTSLALARAGEKDDVFALPEKILLDKVKGAWAGQTIGCSYGGSTEFKFQGTIIQDYIPIAWDKHAVKKWYDSFPGLYDDVYVDLTFVDVFERCGLDAPVDSFAVAFQRTKYPLWHANQMARYNLSQGLKGHESGFWKNNPHAHCIDFQIEADFAGIMSPGMPGRAAEICDRVGHLISYGDGWYGGVYVATMYALAYVEDDVETIVREALRAIPEKSQFHQCMSDVIAWHEEFPKDWKRTWFELQNKWSEEIGCPEGIHNTLNIGTKINCAYVLLGLLYGDGDFTRTVDIATRAGQDSDCNPATAAGILGTVLGYDGIPEEWKGPLREVEDIPFDGTYISLGKAYELSFAHACAMLQQNGCRKEGDVYLIPKAEVNPVPLEVAFDGLYVRDKSLVEKSIDDASPLSFTGTGVVLKGYVAGSLPSDYVAEMDVYIDGKLHETTRLPLDVNQRKCELFFCYDCVSAPHVLTFKWKNPLPEGKIWITEMITYDKK